MLLGFGVPWLGWHAGCSTWGNSGPVGSVPVPPPVRGPPVRGRAMNTSPARFNQPLPIFRPPLTLIHASPSAVAEFTLRNFPACAMLRRHPVPPPRQFEPLLRAAAAVGASIDPSTSKVRG